MIPINPRRVFILVRSIPVSLSLSLSLSLYDKHTSMHKYAQICTQSRLVLCRKGRLEKEYSKAHQFLFPWPDCRMMNGRSPRPCRGGPTRLNTERIRVPRRRQQPQGPPAARYPLISTHVFEFTSRSMFPCELGRVRFGAHC
jgi:hypothetical protein